MGNRLISLNPAFLVPHPTSSRVYGETPSAELIDSVKEIGVKERICVLPDTKTVFSGYRRVKAAIAAGLTLVPVEIHDDLTDDIAIRREILARNVHNERTPAIRAAEIAELAAIEEEVSKNSRQLETGEARSQVETGGRVRDRVANTIGIGHASVSRALELDKILKQAQEEGNSELIERASKAKTISGALKIAKGENPKLAVEIAAEKAAEPKASPDDQDLQYLAELHNDARNKILWIKKRFNDLSLTPLGQYIAHAHGRLVKHLEDLTVLLRQNEPVARDPKDSRLITRHEMSQREEGRKSSGQINEEKT